MRVAYVCSDPGVPVFGTKGCSVHVQAMVRTMLRRGFDVDLFARRTGGEAPADLRNVNLVKLDRPEKTDDLALREERLVELDRPLRIQLQKRGPYDFVYERYALWTSSAMQYAMDSGSASALEVNTPLIQEQSNHRGLVDSKTAYRMTQKAFLGADRLIAVSRAVAHHIESFEGVDPTRIRVQPNGVDPTHFRIAKATIQQRRRNRLTDEFLHPFVPFVVGFTGTLRPWHGMSVLGLAFRRFHLEFPNSELLVVGDGPSRNELLEALGNSAARATTITGKIDHDEVPDYLARMDVAIAPYPDLADFYFSPLKVFEYMACGLPIVASRIGDIPNYLHDRRSGLLVSPGDDVAMTTAIHELRKDPVCADLLGNQAATAVSERHTWGHVLDNVLRPSDAHRDDFVEIGKRSAG